MEKLIQTGKEEVAIVRQDKLYCFRNVSGKPFFVNNLRFGTSDFDSVIDTVPESDYRTIIRSRYVEKGFLEQLDEDGNIIKTAHKGKEQEPITDEFLLKKLKSKSLDKYLLTIGKDKRHIIDRMQKIALTEDLPVSVYMKLNETKEKMR